MWCVWCIMRKMGKVKAIPILAGAFFMLAPAVFVRAHVIPYMAITTDLSAEGQTVRFRTNFNAATDIQEAEGLSRDEKLARVKDYYGEFFSILYGVEPEKSAPCAIAELADYAVDPASQKTTITGTYECPEPVTELSKMYVVTDAFSDIFVRFDHYVSLSIGGRSAHYIFNQWTLTNFPLKEEVVRALFPEPPPDTFVLANFERPAIGQPQAALPYVLKRFLRMGVEHILSGTDHILFLLSMILLTVSFRRTLLLVTSFTVAHSITLILAGLGYVTLTAQIVEPLIAASIVFMAVWNLFILRRNEEAPSIHSRWTLAFGFGLAHGLGFAGALADVSVPSRFFVSALVTFNLGVEAGQLALLALIVPVLMLLRRKLPRVRTKILLICSLLIALVAVYWFIERTL